jgi:signal transduction histidine kinase
VFERFYRADPARDKTIEGVGLGLSLVKWIVDQHGGRIQASSRDGEGSCFTIRLPNIK